MSKNMVNFVVDLASFMILLGLAFTGYIIKYVLLPGTGGLGSISRGSGRGIKAEELWSMTRHQWGDIHFYLAALFVFMMIVHVVLHWKWIKCYMKSIYNREKLNN